MLLQIQPIHGKVESYGIFPPNITKRWTGISKVWNISPNITKKWTGVSKVWNV